MSDIVVMVELTVPQSETGIICVIHWAMQWQWFCIQLNIGIIPTAFYFDTYQKKMLVWQTVLVWQNTMKNYFQNNMQIWVHNVYPTPYAGTKGKCQSLFLLQPTPSQAPRALFAWGSQAVLSRLSFFTDLYFLKGKRQTSLKTVWGQALSLLWLPWQATCPSRLTPRG